MDLLRRTLYLGARAPDRSPYPGPERGYVLDPEVVGREGYGAAAGAVARAVVAVSPRRVVAVDLFAATLGAPEGMEQLAAHTDLAPDEPPDGRVAASEAVVDAATRLLGPDLAGATFVDGRDRPVVRWTDGGRLEFGLPPDRLAALEDHVPAAVVEACRPLEDGGR